MGMETPTLEAPESCVVLLIHLHPKSTLTFRVLPPVSVSARTGMARANVVFVPSVLQQNAPALLETVKPLLLLMAIITPSIVIPFTPRKAKLRPKASLIVIDLLLQAKPATTTPGIGLVTRLISPLVFVFGVLEAPVLLLVNVAGITYINATVIIVNSETVLPSSAVTSAPPFTEGFLAAATAADTCRYERHASWLLTTWLLRSAMT